MTLKELLDKVSELCNDETKDLPVKILNDGEYFRLMEIWHYHLKNNYVEINEIRIS
jgi:hypothetical protein